MCRTREEKSKSGLPGGAGELPRGGSTLTETTQDTSWCRRPHPNSHGLKSKRDFMDPKVEIQVRMDSGELAERKASSKALRQDSHHLLAWLCSQELLLGPMSPRNCHGLPQLGAHLLSALQLWRRRELPPHSPWADGLSLGQSLLPAG